MELPPVDRSELGGGLTGPPPGRLQAVVVAVGDELLYGATIDTNGAWMGTRLADEGIPVLERRVVGDDEDAIASALLDALARADLVILSGGLGPTPDDRTRETVATALGLEMETDPDLVAMLERRFRAFGHTSLPENNLKQAAVPVGAEVLTNPRGSAPGLLLRVPDAPSKRVALLPGVPREMKGIFDEELLPRVRTVYASRLSAVVHRWIYTSGIAESVLSERVTPLLPQDMEGVSIAYLPRLTGVDLRLTVRSVGFGIRAEGAIDRIEQRLAPAVREHRYDADSGEIVDALGTLLKDADLTLAVAESCTGGWIATRITDRPGASEFFLGGVVAYSNAAKVGQLGVEPAVLEQVGAVSEEVALAMARGARERFGADAALAVTGIAGPGGGSEEKPVGTVWYAASVGEQQRAVCRRFPGDREAVRIRSAQAALTLLYRMLKPPPSQ